MKKFAILLSIFCIIACSPIINDKKIRLNWVFDNCSDVTVEISIQGQNETVSPGDSYSFFSYASDVTNIANAKLEDYLPIEEFYIKRNGITVDDASLFDLSHYDITKENSSSYRLYYRIL